MGVVLTKLGWYDRAIKAFDVALSLRPAMAIAHRYLAAIYGKLGQAERSLMHRSRAEMLIDASECPPQPAPG